MAASTTLAERIAYLVRASGIDAHELSALAGLGNSHIGQLSRGDVESIRSTTAESIAAATGATRAWVAFGEGDPPAPGTVAASVSIAAARDAAKRTGAHATASDSVTPGDAAKVA